MLCLSLVLRSFYLTLTRQTFVKIPISSLFTDDLLVLDVTHTPPLPIPPKLGDADLDGFPDILLIVNHTPRLLYSTQCASGVKGCANGQGRRGFQEHQKGTETLSQIKDARGAAWVDMDEDVCGFVLVTLPC